jgi:hypothetical protein
MNLPPLLLFIPNKAPRRDVLLLHMRRDSKSRGGKGFVDGDGDASVLCFRHALEVQSCCEASTKAAAEASCAPYRGVA